MSVIYQNEERHKRNRSKKVENKKIKCSPVLVKQCPAGTPVELPVGKWLLSLEFRDEVPAGDTCGSCQRRHDT